MNFVGLVVCMSGVIVHVVCKLVEQNKKLAQFDAVAVASPEDKDNMAAALLTQDSLDDWDGLEEIDLTPSGSGKNFA